MSDPLDTTTTERRPQRGSGPRLVLGLVALVVVVVFAAINSQSVTVDFLFTSQRAPLVIVIVAAAVLGLLVDRLLVVRGRRRARRRQATTSPE